MPRRIILIDPGKELLGTECSRKRQIQIPISVVISPAHHPIRYPLQHLRRILDQNARIVPIYHSYHFPESPILSALLYLPHEHEIQIPIVVVIPPIQRASPHLSDRVGIWTIRDQNPRGLISIDQRERIIGRILSAQSQIQIPVPIVIPPGYITVLQPFQRALPVLLPHSRNVLVQDRPRIPVHIPTAQHQILIPVVVVIPPGHRTPLQIEQHLIGPHELLHLQFLIQRPPLRALEPAIHRLHIPEIRHLVQRLKQELIEHISHTSRTHSHSSREHIAPSLRSAHAQIIRQPFRRRLRIRSTPPGKRHPSPGHKRLYPKLLRRRRLLIFPRLVVLIERRSLFSEHQQIQIPVAVVIRPTQRPTPQPHQILILIRGQHPILIVQNKGEGLRKTISPHSRQIQIPIVIAIPPSHRARHPLETQRERSHQQSRRIVLNHLKLLLPEIVPTGHRQIQIPIPIQIPPRQSSHGHPSGHRSSQRIQR